ncbi:MFS transporter [Longimicrobium sp.]|uniref:MFS transporter n=1 Tax=Longimicrobium sp. TaxID=2029185 RepID=UPI002E315879|nr:MFS transporter [Longimicrobium sp.]HEX6039220.1 MFS transporter [Longimicrobium sp.]
MPDAPERPAEVEIPTRAFGALRHRNFRVFYVGQLLSLAGTWMQSTAQGWLVLELTNSALLLGIVTAVTSLPTLLFSLWAGDLADRADKRRIILVAQVVSLAAALVLALLTDTERITYPVLLALVFVLGTASAFEIPTRQSFFVDLVGPADLPNAIALNSAAFNATRIVGPALAGVVIGVAGVAACYYANAVSYVAVIIGLLMMRLPSFVPRPRTASTLESIREGLAYIRSDRLVRTLVWLIAGMSVTALPYVMLLPVFARDVLKVGAPGLGSMLSATGTGALAAGVSLAAGRVRVPRGRLILGAAAAFALLLMAFALCPWYPLSLGLLALVGFTMILNNASVNALLQSKVPDHLRGRVMSVYVFMFVGMTPLGSLQAGALARWMGAPYALATGAGTLLLIIAWIAVNIPELRAAE